MATGGGARPGGRGEKRLGDFLYVRGLELQPKRDSAHTVLRSRLLRGANQRRMLCQSQVVVAEREHRLAVNAQIRAVLGFDDAACAARLLRVQRADSRTRDAAALLECPRVLTARTTGDGK